MARVAVIGFGELGSVLAAGLAERGADVAVHSPPRDGLDARVSAAGARLAASLEDAVAGAEVVFSAVPGARAHEVAARIAAAAAETALIADLATAPPEAKAAVGPGYVDAAVLGTVAVSGPAVPIVASGERAAELAAFADAHGMRVTVLPGPAGQATRLKLLRSVYMKGRDALVLELLLAARRLGLEDAVLDSIGGPGEQVPFRELAERLVTGVAVHAGRRADELAASAQLVESAGVEPLLARAGEERLRAVAALGLREAFAAQRPVDAAAVLDEIERRGG